MVRENKKGQSEIMGLAIIMFLIVLGLLLFLSFSIRQKSMSINTEYTYKQLPVLLNKVIFETETSEDDCFGEKIQTLLIKTGERSNLYCNGGMPAKQFTNNFITDVLNETLGAWNMEYRYSVYIGTDYHVCDKENYDSSSCLIYVTNSPNNCYLKDISTENYFFRLNSGGLLNIKLDLCR